MEIEIDNFKFIITYVPGRNTSILIDHGENEDEVIFKYVIINDKKSKVTEELYEDYYELVLEAAREEYEQLYNLEEDDDIDDDGLSIIDEKELWDE